MAAVMTDNLEIGTVEAQPCQLPLRKLSSLYQAALREQDWPGVLAWPL